jgi:opacity protein-like surface antigen
MRKLSAIFLALVAVMVTVAVAGVPAAGVAAEPDRYERGSRGDYAPPPPPPRRGAEVPPPRHAQHGQPYFFAHLGTFEPNDDLDGLKGYDSGMNFDLGIGSRVSPMFAVEGTIGGYSAERGSDEASVVPLTIGGRLIIPHPFFEPYVGGGVGLYFTSLKEAPVGGFSGIDKSETDFGGYLSAGADLWLNPRTALNFEGKYHFVNPSFTSNAGTSFDVNMGGWTVNLGVRLAF